MKRLVNCPSCGHTIDLKALAKESLAEKKQREVATRASTLVSIQICAEHGYGVVTSGPQVTMLRECGIELLRAPAFYADPSYKARRRDLLGWYPSSATLPVPHPVHIIDRWWAPQDCLNVMRSNECYGGKRERLWWYVHHRAPPPGVVRGTRHPSLERR